MNTDEIMALADDYAAKKVLQVLEVRATTNDGDAALICAPSERQALRQAIDKLVADAERYRWLRDLDEDPALSLAAQYTDMNGSAISISQRIDAAIDAARSKT